MSYFAKIFVCQRKGRKKTIPTDSERYAQKMGHSLHSYPVEMSGLILWDLEEQSTRFPGNKTQPEKI